MPIQQSVMAVGQGGSSHACFAIAHAVPRVEVREALRLGPRLLQPLSAAEHQPTALPPSLLVLLHLRGVARLVRRGCGFGFGPMLGLMFEFGFG